MARAYYLGVRLSDAELEGYKRALYCQLGLDVMSNRSLSKSSLFRLLLKSLDKVDMSSEAARGLALEYRSLSIHEASELASKIQSL